MSGAWKGNRVPSRCTRCAVPRRRRVSPSAPTPYCSPPAATSGAALPGLDAPRCRHRGRRAGHAQGRPRAAGPYGRGRGHRAAAAARGHGTRGGGRPGGRAGRVRRPEGPGAACAGPRRAARQARRRRWYSGQLVRHGVRVLPRHTVVEAHGADRLEAVTVAGLDRDGRLRPGTARRIPCDTLAVGHGMLPHTDLAETLGCTLSGTDVRVDGEQRTDVPGVWAAGETTGIGGAALALAEGHIAGRSVAARLHGTTPDPRRWATASRSRTRLREFFAALDAVYTPPADWADRITDDTVVCRCEEVTAEQVRTAVDTLGAGDVRTVKLLTRAGMGWCQGRICGPAVAGLTGCPFTPGRRPFARPVPLGVLAALPEQETD
ncbi:(2Fe-2S)-binding protein [Streptomyces diastatochromogenes]|nr:(2Fe-2S)-binding protein [Streptomyces diastatochromogenes]